MLPLYEDRPDGKMQRHAFGNGNGVFPLGGRSSFRIEPHKYEPRSQSKLRRRPRRICSRAFLAVSTCLIIIALVIFPSLRTWLLMPLSLFTFSASEEFQLETVRYYDLSNVQGTQRGWEREERILLCAPLRDAAPHLPMFFSHLRNLTYPHNLIDLAFLVGDSKDNTVGLLSELLSELQADENPQNRFGELSIMEKDFGQKVNQDVESRHGFAAQASRRKSMAQARNWLLSAALRPTHSWVYWRDVDVEQAPFTILEDLMRHNKDVIVPNVWRPLPEWLGGEQPYDLNSWQESETALALAETLDEDAVIVEGYAEYATWRPHLAYLRDPYGDPDMEMDIDGVGGVSILAKAKVFRQGVHFPAFSFEKHAETEGFGKMAKRMKFSVVGLPHYTIWHLYEPSVDDIRHMEEIENERILKEQGVDVEAEKKAERERLEKEFNERMAKEAEEKKRAENLAKGVLVEDPPKEGLLMDPPTQKEDGAEKKEGDKKSENDDKDSEGEEKEKKAKKQHHETHEESKKEKKAKKKEKKEKEAAEKITEPIVENDHGQVKMIKPLDELPKEAPMEDKKAA